ncbi:hypothetical protein [Sinisalibacter lacisalsi]|nr:hypothetical protein [Sinisalibacter lacisalsi]
MSCTQPQDAGEIDGAGPRSAAPPVRPDVATIQWPHAGPPPLSSRRFTDFVTNVRATPEIAHTINGALLYLHATQIRDRSGSLSSLYDHCQTPQRTCEEVVLVNRLGGRGYREVSGLVGDHRIRNAVGEWANTIHFLPERLGDARGQSLLAVQDSNPFVTAGILYPLYFLDDTSLPPHGQLTEPMRSLAVASLAGYRRGEAYNFWRERPGETSPAPRTGPVNLPVRRIETLAKLLMGPLNPLWKAATAGQDLQPEGWVRRVLDREENPYGFDAAFNIPNDADDTAIVVATQKLHSLLQPRDGITPDMAALRVLPRFRDVGRTKHAAYGDWTGGRATGAFLTWLKDENLDTFSAPGQGIMPLGVNNVVCVVNANALFSLALNNASGWAGFGDARRMLVDVVHARAWVDDCDLYYPQLMMLPYALSRAVRDGGMMHDPALRAAMGVLLGDLLKMQREDGSFPGGKDRTSELSTALAASALLNIGAEVAQDAGLFNAHQRAVSRAIGYLMASRQSRALALSGVEGDAGAEGFAWRAGLFFAGADGTLAQWRSEPYSTAISLEALVKFALGHDLTTATVVTGPRWRLDGSWLRAAR